MPYNPIRAYMIPEGHADPEGDVVFILDPDRFADLPEQRPFKVSSEVMSRASPVFKAMFSPRFTGKANFSSADPLEIPLPESDCQATVWLCFALHQQHLPEGRMPIELVKKIAILCDKYDCARALQPWSRLWLRECRGILFESWWELLWMAYALQDHESFWEASQELVYRPAVEEPSWNDMDSQTDGIGFTLLPTGFVDTMKTQRRRAIQNMKLLLSDIKAAYVDGIENDSLKRKMLDHFDKELTRLGLTPFDRALNEEGVSRVEYKMEDFTTYKLSGTSKSTAAGRKPWKLGNHRMRKAHDAMLGMCLLCAKQGKLTVSCDSFSFTKEPNDGEKDEQRKGKKKDHSVLPDTPKPKPRWRRDPDDEGEVKPEDIGEGNNCMASTRRHHQQLNRETGDQKSGAI